MIKAKLTTFVGGKYRKTSFADIPSDDAVEDIKKAVTYLQKYFDISVEVSYLTNQRAVIPTAKARAAMKLKEEMENATFATTQLSIDDVKQPTVLKPKGRQSIGQQAEEILSANGIAKDDVRTNPEFDEPN